ncbi:MAG: hypothetical protein RLZZ46_173 [Bacteroidota bacterium]
MMQSGFISFISLTASLILLSMPITFFKYGLFSSSGLNLDLVRKKISASGFCNFRQRMTAVVKTISPIEENRTNRNLFTAAKIIPKYDFVMLLLIAQACLGLYGGTNRYTRSFIFI